MDLYQQMYLHLFHRVSDALEQLEQCNYGVAAELLRKGQMECEQIYMDGEPERICDIL